MSVTKEEGGRLNAFAKEPKIQVIAQEGSDSKTSRVVIIAGAVLVISLIVITLTIS